MSRSSSGYLHEVRHEIRRRIGSGEWPAGFRLPTREALAELFAASPSTIQLAIRSLVDDGSVVTSKRGGAHVAASPPECCRFALMLADHALFTDQRPTYFIDCLAAATSRIAELRPGWRMECAQASDPRWIETVRSGALAGILYFGPPQWLFEMTGSTIPIASFILPHFPPWAAVNIPLDNQVLLRSSLRSHLARGRKRIAILDNGGLLGPSSQRGPVSAQFSHIVELVRAAGGVCEPNWIHCADPSNPIVAYQTTHLLFDRPAAQRPDALVLLDDHLLPAVLAAMSNLGLRIPNDISVSVQAHHLPMGPPDGCIRLGFDVATFLVGIVDLLTKVRQGSLVVPHRHPLRIEEIGGPLVMPSTGGTSGKKARPA